jgi:hypothetical protein
MWSNQWRGIAFWLEPDTVYDVRVTFTDPDGVSQSVVQGQVRTRDDTPPSSGRVIRVTPGTVQAAIDGALPGDRIQLEPGTYTNRLTVRNRPGQVNNYITLESADPNNPAVLDGQRTLDRNIEIERSSYWRISNLIVRNVGYNAGERPSNIEVHNGSNGVIIEDCVISGIGGRWRSAGILIQAGNSDNERSNLASRLPDSCWKGRWPKTALPPPPT